CNDTGSVLFENVYPQTYLCRFTDTCTNQTASFYIAVPTGSGESNAKDLQVFTVSGSNPVLPTASLVVTNTSSSVVFNFADFTSEGIHDCLVISPVSRSVSIFGDRIITARRDETETNCTGSVTVTM